MDRRTAKKKTFTMQLCLGKRLYSIMEAASRFELENGGFADLCLTTWLCRRINRLLERETGFEPATSTLARLHSTTELLPLSAKAVSTPAAVSCQAQRKSFLLFFCKSFQGRRSLAVFLLPAAVPVLSNASICMGGKDGRRNRLFFPLLLA